MRHGVPVMAQFAYTAGVHRMHGRDCTHFCSNSEVSNLLADVTLQYLALYFELRASHPRSLRAWVARRARPKMARQRGRHGG